MPDPASPLIRRRALMIAALLGLAVMWVTGAIPRWGQWYSEHPFYRAQVYAFFHGRLALTDHVEGVTHDLAWIEGGVQQVWGLGVPIWLALWEVVGRVIHLTPFPDRIAMLFAIVLSIYTLLRAWFGPGGDRSFASRGAFLFTALLPGLITMLRGRIAVYEEAATYAYFTCMMLFAGTMMMIRRPTTARYLLLLAFAGATGLLRPTLWFYGASCAAVATVLYVRHRGSLRRSIAVVAIASALFLAGGAALYVTNYLRFGNGGEFGHRLNLEDLPGNLYATRFNHPFETVAAKDSAKELVGAMFGRPEQKARLGYFFYERKLHAGQLDVPRWREYYFTPYTWTYVPFILGGLGCVVFAWLRALRRGPAASPRRPGPDLDRETRWLGAWAVLGGIPLLIFYLHSPSVSSRYFLDVGPTFVVLLVISWRYAVTRLGSGLLGTIAFGAFALWWALSAITSTIRHQWLSPVRERAAYLSMVRQAQPTLVTRLLPDVYDIADPWIARYIGGDQWTCACFVDPYNERSCDHNLPGVTEDLNRTSGDDWRTITKRVDHEIVPASRSGGPWPNACSVDDPDPEPPDALPPDVGYVVESEQPGQTMYRNGTNWDLTTAAVAVATYFFVADPEYVEVEVGPLSGRPPGPDFIPSVRAKVQLEELPLVSTMSTPRGVRLRFAGPRTERYRHDLQVVFLAFGSPDRIDQPDSEYNLLRVAWHDPR
jgi:hypothetical protein